MEIKSNDYKQLKIDTEKGEVILLLPIGLLLEEAVEVISNFYGTIAKANEMYKEKIKKEEEDSSSDGEEQDGSQE